MLFNKLIFLKIRQLIGWRENKLFHGILYVDLIDSIEISKNVRIFLYIYSSNEISDLVE